MTKGNTKSEHKLRTERCGSFILIECGICHGFWFTTIDLLNEKLKDITTNDCTNILRGYVTNRLLNGKRLEKIMPSIREFLLYMSNGMFKRSRIKAKKKQLKRMMVRKVAKRLLRHLKKDGDIVGRHADFIIIDDPLNPKCRIGKDCYKI